MPMRELVKVARYFQRLSETVERERAKVLGRIYGYLSDDCSHVQTGLREIFHETLGVNPAACGMPA
jgi:hypothetical protein